MEEGWTNLEKRDFEVDYILTHTGPREVVAELGYGDASDDEIPIRQYLQRIADEAEFEGWYFGHFHVDEEVEDAFFCMYDEVVELQLIILSTVTCIISQYLAISDENVRGYDLQE